MKPTCKHLSLLLVTLVAVSGINITRVLAQSRTILVPEEFATIQDAVDAASPGDQIRVGPGNWCGATVTKPVNLFGEGGATIVGCDYPNILGFRAGFVLPSTSATGTTIRHFLFDGQGVSNSNLQPLAFAVYSFEASNVIVEQNHVVGTVQAITNTGGNGWSVSHNRIEGLTLFTCDGFCGGGVGIAFQQRSTEFPRAMDNSATFNAISGVVPSGLYEFAMVGISVQGQDGTVVKNNRISIAGNASLPAAARAIVVTDASRDSAGPFLTSTNSVVVNNNGEGSEFAVVVDRDHAGGEGNSVGTTIRGNAGVDQTNVTSSSATSRPVSTLLGKANACEGKLRVCFVKSGANLNEVDTFAECITRCDLNSPPNEQACSFEDCLDRCVAARVRQDGNCQ